MYQLVAAGHVYVAQPPLFRIVKGKDRYYIQTDEEMKSQMLQRGLAETQLVCDDGRTAQGESMQRLCTTLATMEEAIIAMERRGISLRAHVMRFDAATGRLPAFHLTWGVQDQWFYDIESAEAFITKQQLQLDSDQPEELGEDADSTAALDGPDKSALAHLDELHEVRTINTALKDLEHWVLASTT